MNYISGTDKKHLRVRLLPIREFLLSVLLLNRVGVGMLDALFLHSPEGLRMLPMMPFATQSKGRWCIVLVACYSLSQSIRRQQGIQFSNRSWRMLLILRSLLLLCRVFRGIALCFRVFLHSLYVRIFHRLRHILGDVWQVHRQVLLIRLLYIPSLSGSMENIHKCHYGIAHSLLSSVRNRNL